LTGHATAKEARTAFDGFDGLRVRDLLALVERSACAEA
jgi:hypothetical protein